MNETENELTPVLARVEEMVRDAENSRLAVGRFLAETFYEGSLKVYRGRGRKRVSLRALEKILRERGECARGFSSLRQMIAAHFQEADLALSEAHSRALSWRARVELLRVKDLSEKSRLAKECIENRWTTRMLAEKIRPACTPAKPRPAKPGVFILTARLEKELEAWTDAGFTDLYALHKSLERLCLETKRLAAYRRALSESTSRQTVVPLPADPAPSGVGR